MDMNFQDVLNMEIGALLICFENDTPLDLYADTKQKFSCNYGQPLFQPNYKFLFWENLKFPNKTSNE